MLQNKQHIFFWRGHVEKKVKNIHFFFKKQGTQQFPKGNQFCVSVILHLNTNRESVSITAKGGIHIFQVSVNLNVLEHYYQKMSYFFSSDFFSMSLKRRPFNLSSQPTPAPFIFQISVPWMTKMEKIQYIETVHQALSPGSKTSTLVSEWGCTGWRKPFPSCCCYPSLRRGSCFLSISYSVQSIWLLFPHLF